MARFHLTAMRAAVLALSSMAVTPAAFAQAPPIAGPSAPAADYCRKVRSVAVDPSGRLFYDVGAPGKSRLAVVGPSGGVPTLTNIRVADELASSGGKLAISGGRVILARASELFEVPAAGPDPGAGARRFSGRPAPPHREENEKAGVPEGSEYLSGVRGDGGPFGKARFASIRATASDEAGNLYISEYIGAAFLQSIRVRFINFGAQPVTFYAGTADELVVAPGAIQSIVGRFGRGNSGDGGSARRATASGAGQLTVQGDRLYIVGWGAAVFGSLPSPANKPGPLVRMVNLTGAPIKAHGREVPPAAIATAAGGGASGFSGDGSLAVGASFSYVTGIAADGGGNLYLADRDNGRIRKVAPDGIVTTLAGSGPAGPGRGGFNGNDLPATAARLDGPVDLAVAGDGRIFLSDEGNEQIRMIDTAGTIRLGPGQVATPSQRCHLSAAPGPAARRPGGGIPRTVRLGLGFILIAASVVLGVLAFRPRAPKGAGIE